MEEKLFRVFDNGKEISKEELDLYQSLNPVKEKLFRIWDNEEQVFVGEFDLYKDLVPFDLSQSYNGSERYEIDSFIGVKSIAGKRMYESDIVKGEDYTSGTAKRFVGVVKQISSSYKAVGVKQYRGVHASIDGSFEVIGTKYQNPEML